MSTIWSNAVRAATNFINGAIAGIAHWSDGNVKWSDPQFAWSDVTISYVNQAKSVVTGRSYLPLGAWLFWLPKESDAISPIAWDYETKH